MTRLVQFRTDPDIVPQDGAMKTVWGGVITVNLDLVDGAKPWGPGSNPEYTTICLGGHWQAIDQEYREFVRLWRSDGRL